MTFDEQIAGVPLPLIQQGWRLQPDNEFDSNWRRQSPANRWDYEAIEVDGAFLDIARPVIESANRPRVYAHAGWGDGLAPTPEMVKVWKWWWVGDSPVHVRFVNGSMVIRHPFADSIENHAHEWRGPVLPPMEMSP